MYYKCLRFTKAVMKHQELSNLAGKGLFHLQFHKNSSLSKELRAGTWRQGLMLTGGGVLLPGLLLVACLLSQLSYRLHYHNTRKGTTHKGLDSPIKENALSIARSYGGLFLIEVPSSQMTLLYKSSGHKTIQHNKYNLCKSIYNQKKTYSKKIHS